MKKVLTAGALSSALLLSGCSFGAIQEQLETPAVSESTAESQKMENPENLFFEFATASGENGLEKIGLADFDKELLVKSKADITIDGDFNMEGIPMVNGGTGTFNIGINAIMDYSDETNPLLSEIISTKIDALGELFTLDTSAEIRVVNKSAYIEVSKFDTNFPGLTPEVKTVIQKFVGQWYGNSFEEINTLISEAGAEGFNTQQLLTGTITPTLQTLALIEDIAENPKNHINFGKFVKEENGYYFFEVTPKKETYAKFADILINFIDSSGLLAKLTEDNIDFSAKIKKAIEEMSIKSITIAYTPEHPEYFKISKIIDEDGTTVLVQNTADGVRISIANIEGDNAGEVLFTKNSDGKFSLTVEIPSEYNGEKTEILSGTCTEDKHDFTLSLPLYDYELGEEKLKEVLKGSFVKNGDTWSGELTSPELKDGKLVISEVTRDLMNIHAKISAIYNEKTITNITFDVKSEKPEGVAIDTPENVKPFTQIQSDIETEMNALYGTEETTEETTDDSVVINDENIEVKTEDAAVIINNGAIEVKTDAVEVVIDENAQGGADHSAISGKLARMAELMNENPNNNEAKNEYTKLAQEVKEYANETGMAKETMKELLMKEIVKQVQ